MPSRLVMPPCSSFGPEDAVVATGPSLAQLSAQGGAFFVRHRPLGKRWRPSLPGVIGIVLTGVVWWPAIFGV